VSFSCTTAWLITRIWPWLLGVHSGFRFSKPCWCSGTVRHHRPRHAEPSRETRSVRFGHDISCIIYGRALPTSRSCAIYGGLSGLISAFFKRASAVLVWLGAQIWRISLLSGHARPGAETGCVKVFLPRVDECVCGHRISFAARLGNLAAPRSRCFPRGLHTSCFSSLRVQCRRCGLSKAVPDCLQLPTPRAELF
jgi:hypothetical protein